MSFVIRPVTPDLWPALEDLFGKNGACNGCWCMYWRIGSLYRQRDRSENRDALKTIVRRGPPPGLLAMEGDTAIGWCQLTPRSELAWLDRSRITAAVDDRPVWSISCFYVRRGYRGQGVTAALIRAAIKAARQAGAPALEAYPRDAAKHTVGAFTGFTSTFASAGFGVAAQRVAGRPVMRYELDRGHR
jgi:GNAT superfamily N-acetyltransferase